MFSKKFTTDQALRRRPHESRHPADQFQDGEGCARDWSVPTDCTQQGSQEQSVVDRIGRCILIFCLIFF